MDSERIERAVREILLAIGEDPDREGLCETPKRMASMYAELFSGMKDDPRRHMKQVFQEKYDEMVIVRDISFNSMCEHHLMPFFGKAHLAYLSAGKLIGISKLARVVETYALRPQIQERMTCQIADFLYEQLDALGVAVVLEATHTCMTIRGIKKPGSLVVTSALRGRFRQDLGSRNEVLSLLHQEYGR